MTRPSPDRLNVHDLYDVPVLGDLLSNPSIGGANPQVALLLGDHPLDVMLAESTPPVLLDGAEQIEGRPCDRIQLARGNDKLVLFVDQKTHELRRLELPTSQFTSQYDPTGAWKNVRLTAEFGGAKLDAAVPADVFQLEIPDEAILLPKFVIAQPPGAPNPLVGKPAPEFTLSKVGGGTVSLSSLKDKIVILDIWATDCPHCLRSMPNLEEVYQKYLDNSAVQILAVSVDPPEITDKQLQETFDRMQVKVPIVRDTDGKFFDAYDIGAGIPQLFLIGEDGTLEEFAMGYNPRLASILPERIDALRAGKKLHLETLNQYAEAKREYRAHLERVAKGDDSPAVEPDESQPAARSEPKKYTLKQLWTVEGVKQPGNIYQVPTAADPEKSELLVFDGWRSLVQVDAEGQVVGRHELDLPADQVATYLRWAIDEEGQRQLLVSAQHQPQVHLLDGDWKVAMSHPEGKNPGIVDAQLGDITGDSQPEALLGYAGGTGLHCVSLKGQRMWVNKTIEHLFSIALVDPDTNGQRIALCANTLGTVKAVGPDGQSGRELKIGESTSAPQGRFMRWIVSSDLDGDEFSEYCGLGLVERHGDIAVGFGLDGRELWHYDLPKGNHQLPIEPIASGPLPGRKAKVWAIAGADGSIHLVSATGEAIDHFNYGTELSGLALVELNGKPVLLVSSSEGLVAWEMMPSE